MNTAVPGTPVALLAADLTRLSTGTEASRIRASLSCLPPALAGSKADRQGGASGNSASGRVDLCGRLNENKKIPHDKKKNNLTVYRMMFLLCAIALFFFQAEDGILDAH